MQLSTDQDHGEHVAINSVDQVMQLVGQWHDHMCKELAHMTHIPTDGSTEFSIAVPVQQEDGSWMEEERVLTTEMERVAFVAGLREALSKFVDFPFYQVETAADDEDPTESPSEDSGT